MAIDWHTYQKLGFLSFARCRQIEFNMAAYADDGFKQKAVIEFLTKEGINPKEISDRLTMLV